MVSLADVDLSEEDLALRQTVRALVDREIAPRAAEVDRSGDFPTEQLRLLGELGLAGLLVPAEHGGLAGTRLQITLVLEELARGCGSTAMTLMAHLHASGLVAAYGTDDQRARWLPALADGRRLGAIALTEPEAGSDPSAMRATARPVDGGYRLEGTKVFITNGDRAGLVVAFARVVDAPAEGIAGFLLDGAAPGVEAGTPMAKLGLRASSTVALHLDGVVVGEQERLGEVGDGLRLAFESLDGARMSTAAQAVGLARAALEAAVDHAAKREQGGGPIGRHQAVQLRLGELWSRLEAARALLYRVARLIDVAGATGQVAEAAAAKVVCTTTATEVASGAVELLGGYGFMEDHPPARLLRDAKGGEIYDGTNDINRLLIARRLLRGR